MEPQDILNRSEENQEDQNPNPPPPHNVNIEIDEVFVILRTLEEQLRETREPSRVSLATSLDIIVQSRSWSTLSSGSSDKIFGGMEPIEMDIMIVWRLGDYEIALRPN